jgi:2-oxoglutarate dehydrogenase E2 component (dihydrolipoamide succinyltransferase)
MAILELKVPSPGESITEVTIVRWLKQDGDVVEKDEELCEVDSDKATLTINAEEAGAIKIKVSEGTTVKIGDVICTIDTAVQPLAKPKTETKKEEVKKVEPTVAAQTASSAKSATSQPTTYASGHPSPAAKKLMDENGIAANKLSGSGKDGRITKGDVLNMIANGFDNAALQSWGGTRDQRRDKMTTLRKKLAQRLVAVKQETAMLTTFNEVDMSAMMAIRNKYKDIFKEKHGIGLGFMSFFTKAVCEALRQFPAVNAQIDGDEIVYHDYCDIGIAVSAPKGLMVPIIRNAEIMNLAQIESEIKRLALRARDGKITVDEMTGGTFTITNGGVFGSLMSTPIINPPQSAILGMHNIVDRPVAVNGQVVIRPMMYVALSYDHRIIDGKESVSFLVTVKQMLENPHKLIFGGKDPDEVLLGL